MSDRLIVWGCYLVLISPAILGAYYVVPMIVKIIRSELEWRRFTKKGGG